MKSSDDAKDNNPGAEFRRVVDRLAAARAEQRAAEDERQRGPGLRQVLQRVAAALRFDSRGASAPAAGLRGALTATRHLLFSAKGRDIDLRVSPAGGRYTLSGQVLGPDEGGSAELAAHPRVGVVPPPTRRTSIDALGEFHLDDIDEGSYVLTLQLGADAVVLPPIDMRDGD